MSIELQETAREMPMLPLASVSFGSQDLWNIA